MALNYKQEVFISRYLVHWNATRAALDAGYSEKTARSIGSENLTKPDISAEIRRRVDEITMSADEVLVRLSTMARSNITDFAHIQTNVDLANLGDAGQVIKKFKRKITHPKQGEPYEEIELELYPADVNLERVGRIHGMLNNTDAGSSEDKPFIVKVVYGERINTGN